MYITDTLESLVLLSGNNGLEFLSVSVYDASKPTQKLHVGVWYQPPHDREAIKNLFEILDVRVFSTFVLFGFNIDFLNQEHPLFSKLLYIINSFDLTQVVLSPTHVSHNGKETLIDLALISS